MDTPAQGRDVAARDADLLDILKIGHETSMRGSGISLRDALTRTRYRESRATFGPPDLLPLVRMHREFVTQWLAYSEDKRTSGGWSVKHTGEVGQLEPETRIGFDSLEEAVAEYVVRELDFWADLGKAGQ